MCQHYSESCTYSVSDRHVTQLILLPSCYKKTEAEVNLPEASQLVSGDQIQAQS